MTTIEARNAGRSSGASSLSVDMPDSGPDGVRFSLGRRPRQNRYGIWAHEDTRGVWWFTRDGWLRATVGEGGSRAGPRPSAAPKESATARIDVIDSIWTAGDGRRPFFYLRGAWIAAQDLDSWVRQQLHGATTTPPAAHLALQGEAGDVADSSTGEDGEPLGLQPLLWLARPHERRGMSQLIEVAERLLLFFLWNRRGLDGERGHSVIFPASGVPAPWTLPTLESPRPGSGLLPGRSPPWMDDPTVAYARNALALAGAIRLQAAKLLDAKPASRGVWAVLARVHRLLVANRTWTEARGDPAGSPAQWLASEALWTIRQVVFPSYPDRGPTLFGRLRHDNRALRNPVSRADLDAATYFLKYQTRPPADWLRWSPGCPSAGKASCASCAGHAASPGSLRTLWPAACPCAATMAPGGCAGCAKSAGAAASHAQEAARGPPPAVTRSTAEPAKSLPELTLRPGLVCPKQGECGARQVQEPRPDEARRLRP